MSTGSVPALSSKVIAVTGASAGIGAVSARLLAARGHRVVLAARHEEALGEMVAAIREAGGEALACEADVTRAADLVRLVTLAREHFGRLDVLVANAGLGKVAPLAEGDVGDWDAMIDVNLRGVLHGIAAALPVFGEQGSGHFITVTSTSSIKWVPGQGVYAATKAGVRAVMEVLRQEVGPEIRVTSVCPGATATGFIAGDAPGLRDAERDLAERMRAIAMEPDAVAEAILYALEQPAGINVGEIVVRSARQP